MEIEEIHQGERIGIRFIFIDEGPGIANVEQAIQDGFSTSNGLGHGLPGSKRLMDYLQIESELGATDSSCAGYGDYMWNILHQTRIAPDLYL